jgi:hypothetical protein
MKNLISVLLIVGFFMSCNNSQQQALESINKQKTIDSLNAVMAEQKIIDSMKAVSISQEKARISSTNDGAVSNQNTEPASAPKKKGWSGAAKGAVIGAGVGAGTGAIIDNNKKKKAARVATSKQ